MEPASLLLGFVLGAGALWAAISLLSLRVNARTRHLRPPAELPAGRPRVSAVVPARDEEDAIEASVRSLLAQEGVELEVVVVNDHSSDRTGAILDRLAAEDPRLVVLHDPPLPPGRLGKVNALEAGAARATGDFLLFSDADVRHHPRSVVAGVGVLEEEERDLLALLPRMEWEDLFENVLVIAFVVALIQFGSTRLEDPEHPGEAAGSGSYNLVRRTAYEAVGGHAPLRTAVVDDIELGRLVKRSGYRVGFRFGPELLRIRMYRGNRAAFWGVAKNVVASMDGSIAKTAGAAVVVAAIVLAGPVGILGGALLGEPRLLAAGLGLYGLQLLSLVPLRSWHRFRPLKLAAFPLFSVVILSCTARGAWARLQGRVVWKGRRVHTG